MSEGPACPQSPLDELSEAAKPWWQRHSSHGEAAWSAGVSLAMHIFLVLLIVVAATSFAPRQDPTPPSVDVIVVGPEEDAAPDESSQLTADDTLEEVAQEPSEQQQVVIDSNPEELADVTEPEGIDIVPPVHEESDPNDEAKKAEETLKRVKAAGEQQLERLRERLNNSGPSGAGGVGSGTGERGDRVARWVLKFPSHSDQHYLQQIDALGGMVAFPVEGGKWRYFRNVSSTRPKSEDRSLESETRLYWKDVKTYHGAARILGMSSAPMMCIFLPLELEERMLKMELDYQGLAEDQILTTHYETYSSGGKIDVKVRKQVPKPR